jgi:hypothetical protein
MAETVVSMHNAISTALQQLTSMRLAYLVSSSVLTSTYQLSHNTANPIPEVSPHFPMMVPQTVNENLLLDTIHEMGKQAEGF